MLDAVFGLIGIRRGIERRFLSLMRVAWLESLPSVAWGDLVAFDRQFTESPRERAASEAGRWLSLAN